MMAPEPRPLSRAELQAFAKQQPPETALALLTELYRLQGIARLADDVRRRFPAALPAEDATWQALVIELELYRMSRDAAAAPPDA